MPLHSTATAVVCVLVDFLPLAAPALASTFTSPRTGMQGLHTAPCSRAHPAPYPCTPSQPARVRRRQCSAPAVQQEQVAAAAGSKVGTARPWLPLTQPAIWQGTEEQALSSSECFQRLSPTWKVMLLSDGSVTRHLQLLTGSPVSVECLEMVNIGSSTEGLPDPADTIRGPRVQRTVLLRPSAAQPTTHAEAAPWRTQRAANGNGTSTNTPHTQPAQPEQPLSLSSPQGTNTTQQQHSTNGHVSSSSSNGSNGQSQAASVGQGEKPPPLVYAVSWWDAEEVDRYLSDRSKPIWVSLSQGHVELYREVQSVHFGHNAALEAQLGCPGPFWGRKYLFWHNDRPLTLIYEVFSNRLEQYLGPKFVQTQHEAQ